MGWAGPVTHRQFLVTQYWLKVLDLNSPGKLEHYLMAVRMEVKRQFSKNPGRVKLEDMKIPFKLKKTTYGKPLTPERVKEVTAQSKARWGAALGRGKNNIPLKRPTQKLEDSITEED